MSQLTRFELQLTLSMAQEMRTSMVLIFFLIFLFLQSVFVAHADISCNVLDFGAKGDGVSYDTPAIQQAIDTCSGRINDEEKKNANAMAVIFLPAPGRYLTGTLFLRSHTILHISPGATLLGSSSQDHYAAYGSTWYLVLAANVTDVGITGSVDTKSYADFDPKTDMGLPGPAHVGATSSNTGAIDGQSSKFVVSFNSIKNVMVSWNKTGSCSGDECRPRLLGFLDCERIHIWDIQLLNPAYWCTHVVRSNDVTIHHVSILGDFDTPNNDGIDIDSSNNTYIYRCKIDTGDDAICPKTYYGPVHNLTASHCWIRTKSCGVKFGSATYYDFYGIKFNQITIADSHRGIGLQLRDSGNIYDVVFSNFNIMTRYYDVSWWGRAEPIYLTSCPRSSSTVAGSIYNISFVNITAVSENGIFMSGKDGGLLRNVVLENVKLHLHRITNYTGGLLDYRPGCQGLVEHQNSGIFVEQVSGLLLNNVQVFLDPNISTPFVPIDIAPSTLKENIKFMNFSLLYQTYALIRQS
ncbi:hypothetical protein KP509_25G077000 [Ceratopteris richardii]|uniref:Rhamnogalacturonase A/B/Epimerase-like pectate lyase domain-containing protein n=1 Tax=Ceratopteris richardii TaxID=49495 RepID=A0A8T2RRV1_CERRI|nr:hypothetical protein KP509_25G077000 [Ceratopteris richardii]